MSDETNSCRELRLPAELCAALEKRIQGTKFRSLEDFLTYVLRELTSSGSEQAEEQERKVIEQRLRELGYL